MDLPNDWTTGTVRANGVALRYGRVGDGTTLVMAHGFYDSGARWVPLAEDLADDYEVVVYDARAHGESDAPESGYEVEDRVADLVGVVDELGIEDPVLVGHSMGGATVAWVVAEHPDLPRGLVLEDPEGMHRLPEVEPEELAEMTRQNLERVSGLSVDEVIEEHFAERESEQARRLATASLECSPQVAEIARAGYPSTLAEILPEITCPTLVLCSDGETERRIQDLDAADSLPDGRLLHVPDAGHYVMEDAYDAYVAEIRTFLGRL